MTAAAGGQKRYKKKTQELRSLVVWGSLVEGPRNMKSGRVTASSSPSPPPSPFPCCSEGSPCADKVASSPAPQALSSSPRHCLLPSPWPEMDATQGAGVPAAVGQGVGAGGRRLQASWHHHQVGLSGPQCPVLERPGELQLVRRQIWVLVSWVHTCYLDSSAQISQ